MKIFSLLVALMMCSACVQMSDLEQEERDYRRVEYFQTVFLPVSQACSRAGGFMIFEDTARNSSRHYDLSYTDMKIAVARGCAGI